MSVWFVSASGRDLWNPSTNAAQFFLHGIRGLETFLDRESGIGEIAADEVTVEPQSLAELLADAQNRLGHPTMRLQSIGLLAIAAVLLQRCGVAPSIATGWEQLRRETELAAQRMPAG